MVLCFLTYLMMKRITVSVLVALLAIVSIQAGAQSYIGGTVSFGTSSNSSGAGVLTSFGVSPDLGWFLSDKCAVGIRPAASFSFGGNSQRSCSFGMTPYLQYRLFNYNRFGLWAEGDASLGWSFSRVGGIETSRNFSYSLRALPVLTFDISDRVRLQTRLGFFSIHVSGNRSGGYSNFSSGFSASTQALGSILDDATIGFLYSF